MKALISLLTLSAIVLIYVLGANLYIQGQLFLSYSFVLTALASLVFWIKSNDLLKVNREAA